MHAADAVAVAWDAAARPTIGFAGDADGSFVMLDGELFAEGDVEPPPPDDAARAVLDALRRRGTRGLDELHLEALVTWWDAPGDRVHVVRDHTGVIGGLVASRRGTTVWSSEPDGVLAAGMPPEPDPVAIDQLLTVGWVTPPRSPLRGVETIAAGHEAVVRPGRGHELERWHALTARPPLTGSLDEQATLVGDAIVAAVARRSHGGRLGATLSSGVDSTVLVAILRRVLDREVDTFTFRYLDYEGPLNEDEHAAATAAFLGAPHHVVGVSPHDLADRFEWMVGAYQSPFTFGVHSFNQAAVLDAGVTTMLGGSDPGFWRDYGATGALVPALRRLPLAARSTARRLLDGVPKVPGRDVARFALMLADNGVMNEQTPLATRRALHGRIADEGVREMARALDAATRAASGEPRSHRAVLVFEQHGIPEYVAQWNHRWARAHGFTQRAPLWDRGVVDVLNRRTPWGGDKPALRRYASTLVPPERATFRKIHQEVPLGQWFRGPLRSFVTDALSPSRVHAAGLFDPSSVQRVVTEHLDQGRHGIWTIWVLLTATEWSLQLQRRSGASTLVAPLR